MILRVFRALRAEIAQALRTRTFYAGPLLIVATVAAIAGLKKSQGAALDYEFIAYATGIAYGFGGLLLVLVYAALLVSADTASGTIRLLLTAPLKRHEYLVAKALYGLGYAVFLLTLTAASTWSLAMMAGQLGGVVYGGEVVYTARQMQVSYLEGMALSLITAAAAVAFGLLWSVCWRSTAGALVSTIGSWVVIDAAKYPFQIDQIVFWSYWTTPWMAFRNRCDVLPFEGRTDTVYCIAVSALWLVICFGAAVAVLRKKNL